MVSKSISSHNWSMQRYAKEFASSMQMSSSPLEEKMMEFLDKYNFYYVTQKIFYITKDNGYIDKFFIADFYFPEIKVILETDGQFHKKQVKKDAKRTELITSNYPDIKIIRWEWKDFDNPNKVNWLLNELHYNENIKSKKSNENKNSLLSMPDNEFIMCFLRSIPEVTRYDGNTMRVLMWCWMFSSFNVNIPEANTITNDKAFKEKIRQNGGDLSDSAIDKAIHNLYRGGMLQRRCKGSYFLNPNYFFRGTLTNRAKLQYNISFDKQNLQAI